MSNPKLFNVILDGKREANVLAYDVSSVLRWLALETPVRDCFQEVEIRPMDVHFVSLIGEATKPAAPEPKAPVEPKAAPPAKEKSVPAKVHGSEYEI
jgi:hypothetical protein